MHRSPIDRARYSIRLRTGTSWGDLKHAHPSDRTGADGALCRLPSPGERPSAARKAVAAQRGRLASHPSSIAATRARCRSYTPGDLRRSTDRTGLQTPNNAAARGAAFHPSQTHPCGRHVSSGGCVLSCVGGPALGGHHRHLAFENCPAATLQGDLRELGSCTPPVRLACRPLTTTSLRAFWRARLLPKIFISFLLSEQAGITVTPS